MDNTAMITASPTFCTAPWTMLNIDQTGRVMPCMHSGYELGNIKQQTIQQVLAGNNMRELKHTMARGEWHEACAWCKQLEDTTGTSGRTVRQITLETAAAINQDIDWFGLEHIVVNWSNLCNLTCVYCNPETSTAWQSVKKIPIVHVKNEHQDLIELAREHGHTVQGLTLGGGEPLLQRGLVEFLQCLNPEQVRVMVTTNLSVDIANNAVYNELRNWPMVDWMVSFDNADRDKFEYVRAGADWTVFVNNIKLMKQHGQHVIAHPAYSIYCALDLWEYYEFCLDHELDIFWCELTNPWDLDIRRMPESLRQQAMDEIDRVVERFAQYPQLSTDALLRYQATLKDTSYIFNPEYRPNPLKFHKLIETELGKSVTFQQLWPKLSGALDE